MEIDVWIPDLSLSFEFQDAYHYVPNWASNIPLSEIKRKDKLKRDKILRQKETLVVIPCWWNGTIESLIETIKSQRPELLSRHTATSSCVLPIPLNPPLEFFAENDLPFIGNLMLASFPTANFHESISPLDPWWMGEKYDGIRCCWVHPRKKLFSRYGADLELPEPFFQHAPNVTLDGEIWFGRGMFQDSRRIVWLEADMEDWIYVRNVVFDVPDPSWTSLPFEGRYSHMLFNLTYDNPFFKLFFNYNNIPAARLMVGQMQRVNLNLNDIIQDGGEGVILRKPKSLYEKGRSNLLLKLKASRGDREALVTDLGENHSLILQLPGGEVFKVKSESVVCSPSPQVGDVVTFSYDHYSRYSLPVDPKVYRIRPDLDWKDVLQSFQEESQAQDLNGDVVTVEYESYSRSAIPLNPIIVRTRRDLNWDHVIKNYSHQEPLLDKPKNYWNPRTMRKFMEDFAKQRNKDPLHPHTWYSILRSDFAYEKWPFNFQNVSYVNTVIKLFPELNLEPSKFGTIASGYWNDIKNRRKVIEDYCTRVGIDPLVPSSWNFIEPSSFDNTLKYVLQKHYKGSFTNAISHLYPNVQHSSFSFSSSPVSSPKIFSRKIIRQVFDRFAHENKFNPLVAKNWYSMPIRQILSRKEIYSVIKKSKMGVKAALSEAYPNVVFQNNEFLKGNYIPKQSLKNKKILFDEFAQKHGFDPLNPNNWYQISKKTLLNILRPERKSLSHYQKVEALKTLVGFYPNIGMVVEKFKYR